jgi:prophage regulatory protein
LWHSESDGSVELDSWPKYKLITGAYAMLERRFRVKDLVNYPERPAKDYIDRSGRRRRITYKPAVKGLLNLAESTFWKMIRRGDFPEPTYLTASMPTWSESQINAWLEQKELKAA